MSRNPSRFTYQRLLSGVALVACGVASLGCPGPDEPAASRTSPPSTSTPADSGSVSSDSAVSEQPELSRNTSAPDAAPDAAPESTPVASSSTESGTEPSAEPSAETIPTTQAPATQPPTASAQEPSIEFEAPQEYEGWGEPTVALVVSGRLNGYIEPCGCTGLASQKGGLLRRDSMIEQLRARGWEVLPIDLGNQEHRYGVQASIKFTRVVEAMVGLMGYQAIGIGPDDLRLPSTDLVQAIENAGSSENVFASANVALFGDYLPKYRVLQSGEHKIGITSVLGPKAAGLVNNSDVELTSTGDAIPAVLTALNEADCELKVLMAYASMEETEELIRNHPEFDLVVCSGVDGEPTLEPTYIEVGDRRVPVVQTGYKGMYVGVVGWFPGTDQPLRYQRVPLDARFEDSERIRTVFKAYQDQLESMGLAGLELNPVRHPSGRSFVGSTACGDCHTTAYEIWKNGVDGEGGPHAHATVSLVEPGERTWVKRHFDPECLSCHTTGWNPQLYFPYEGGYVELEASFDLHGNGCENCHGPGDRHVAAENGDLDVTAEELVELQQEMHVELEATMCMECHDLDNSPDFHEAGAFEKYWAQIVHEGKD